MAARHQREARFALRYETHLTVDRLTAAAVALTVAEPASALAWLLYASLPIHMNDVPVFSSPAFSIPAFSVAPFRPQPPPLCRANRLPFTALNTSIVRTCSELTGNRSPYFRRAA